MEQKSLKIFIFSDPVLGVPSWDLGIIIVPAFLPNSNGRLDFLGQHKRQREFPIVIRESHRKSRKTTWLPRHRKMKPFPATAPQEKAHVRNWRSKGPLAPLMRPTKFPEIPVSLERNTEVFRHPLL